MERLIIYLRRKGAKGRLMLVLSTCWKCRECWEKRNTSSHKKLNSLVPTCYNNVTFPAFLRGNIGRVGVGACQCQLCKWYQRRVLRVSGGHHNIFNPCLSLVSSDRILTYWKLRKIFPSRSEMNDLNLSKLIASIREISVLMLNTKACLPTCFG